MRDRRVFPAHGGYRKLRSFQLARLVYDLTIRFCNRYVDRRSRTRDQMVQAARSGAQNIAEGSQASATSAKFEIKLTSVARASLEELRLDYEDFLRQRQLPQWERDDGRRRSLLDARARTADEVAAWILADVARQVARDGGSARTATLAEYAANAALVLIGVTSSLLERQIAAQLEQFERRGGLSERLYRARTGERGKRQ